MLAPGATRSSTRARPGRADGSALTNASDVSPEVYGASACAGRVTAANPRPREYTATTRSATGVPSGYQARNSLPTCACTASAVSRSSATVPGPRSVRLPDVTPRSNVAPDPSMPCAVYCVPPSLRPSITLCTTPVTAWTPGTSRSAATLPAGRPGPVTTKSARSPAWLCSAVRWAIDVCTNHIDPPRPTASTSELTTGASRRAEAAALAAASRPV